MKATKTGKSVYLVIGVSNGGSGSLTFPEDFEFIGVFDKESDAQDLADHMNQETLEEQGIELEEGESLSDFDPYDLDSETTWYRVEDLDVLELKRGKTKK